jgi:predicted aldo/keto reductase-like oxidoreductase
MKHRRFGNTDLMVSMIGLGCYGMSGAYGPGDDAESIATIHRALDLGVNFFDTSARCASIKGCFSAVKQRRGGNRMVEQRLCSRISGEPK